MNQAERDSLSRPKIAVIDDDLRLARLVKVVLEEADQTHDVLIDADVVQAYDFVKRVHPDLIILDIMMGVDPVGFETLDQLSNNPDMCHIPVVVLCGPVRKRALPGIHIAHRAPSETIPVE